jgi:carboxyl-terminal processing protease
MRIHVQRLMATVSMALVSLMLLGQMPARADQDADAEYYELMKVFVDTFEQIERNYVKDVDRKELMEAAIRGMLRDLDQYSNYISPDDLVRFKQDVDQEFGGIGIQVQVDERTKRLTVMTPLPGTPAYRAGVLAGDTIMEIEGKSTEGFTLQQAVQLLKGKAGEEVTIGIQHPGSDKVEQVKIVREIILVKTVLGDRYEDDDRWNFMLDDESKIGYIRLTHFSRHSAEELREALDTLKSRGMKGLILDLRFNPGGLLSQATEIADLFIDSGKIVSTKGRNSPDRVWNAKKRGTYSGFPMAVLVNGFSASASEIVGACLQDHERAKVIGDRTWGKGSVQNVIDLNGGSSALKLTTASYHRPSGKNIHRFPGAKDADEWGVMPDEDFQVKLSTKEMQDYLKYRQQRDVLSKEGPPESDFTDKQLKKAVDYLLAELGGKKSEDATEADKAAEGKSDEEAKPAAKETDERSSSSRRSRLIVPAMGAAA